MNRVSRRGLLWSGFGAVAAGLLTRRGWGIDLPSFDPAQLAEMLRSGAIPNPTGRFGRGLSAAAAGPIKRGDPLRRLDGVRQSIQIAGLPFHPWFTGDDFRDAIPFHVGDNNTLPTPTEEVDVAIVGGGISGLSTAYLLREFSPVLFELRDQYGGNAMGEIWGDPLDEKPYSMGTAYVISTEEGEPLHDFYRELGVLDTARFAGPQDPVEVAGVIRKDFWTGAGFSPDEQMAFERYATVVSFMANESYPDIPLPEGKDNQWILDLDRQNFLENLESQMGLPLPPVLKAAVQAYFYSSFGYPMQQISAASGWNFVAAEEYGRYIWPGGVGYLARAMWRRLAELEEIVPPDARPRFLRSGCRVFDVRLEPDGRARLTYVDAAGVQRALRAKAVVLACAKHICKHVIHDLVNIDQDKFDACAAIYAQPYLVANVLLNARVERDYYDLFLLRDPLAFPQEPDLSSERRPLDVIFSDYASARNGAKTVMTMYWPLPFGASQFTLLLNDPFTTYANLLAPRLREFLKLINVPDSAVEQIRITRWGHAMPVAGVGLIADGYCEAARRPMNDTIFFVNQDNWALPAVENSVLDAFSVAEQVRGTLRG